MNLGKDVNLISLQDAPQGNLDILLYVRGVSCGRKFFFFLMCVHVYVTSNFPGDGFGYNAHHIAKGRLGHIEQRTALRLHAWPRRVQPTHHLAAGPGADDSDRHGDVRCACAHASAALRLPIGFHRQKMREQDDNRVPVFRRRDMRTGQRNRRDLQV